MKNIYFLGIGGIGMSALARFFHQQGRQVAGYDLTQTPITENLTALGIPISYQDEASTLPENFHKENTWVIYTPAIPKTSALWNFFVQEGFAMSKRSEALGEITKSQKTLAVAGTHGKTTTSTLLAHLLAQRPAGVNAFLGGIAKNYKSNLITSPNSQDVVLEADEFDRTFLRFYPDLAIVTAMDADHLDIYQDHASMLLAFAQFIAQIKANGFLLYQAKLQVQAPENVQSYSYGFEADADFRINNMQIKDGSYYFDIAHQDKTFTQMVSHLPGKHNVENTCAALVAAYLWGVSEDLIRQGLDSFKGIERRFDCIYKSDKLIYIEDYAHHPEELRAAISAAKALYPHKKCTGIFQPHLFTRTRDFIDDFAKSLELLDELWLLPIYPARELPIAGVNSAWLFEKIALKNKVMLDENSIFEHAKQNPPELLLMLGAGDAVKWTPKLIDTILHASE